MPFDRTNLAVIKSFTEQLGLPLRPARDGSFSFTFASTGTLSLTASENGAHVIVSLGRRPNRIDADLMERALSLAGFEPAGNTLVRAGLSSDDTLHVAMALDASRFDLPSLDAALQGLSDLHERIA